MSNLIQKPPPLSMDRKMLFSSSSGKHRRDNRSVDLSVVNIFADLRKHPVHMELAERVIDTLASHGSIKSCPLFDMKMRFSTLQTKFIRYPKQFLVCTGVKGVFEGIIASNPCGPCTTFFFACARSILGDVFLNSMAQTEVDEITKLKEECKQLCEELEKQYETLSKYLEDRYFKMKFDFEQGDFDTFLKHVTQISKRLESIEKAIHEDLQIKGTTGDSLVDPKKILAPFRNSVLNILKNEGNPLLPPSTDSEAVFKDKLNDFEGKRRFQDQLTRLQTQQKENAKVKTVRALNEKRDQDAIDAFEEKLLKFQKDISEIA